MQHSLNVRKDARPLMQALRHFTTEKRQAIGEEIAWLPAARFIKEVANLEWLANPVRVSKKNISWPMCVDYTDLNRACPKDPFPLPQIVEIIDSTMCCERLCFLDAYSGYHHIRMKGSDHEKTSFITPYDPFCYTTMPFELKNAGATYQRTMLKCFHDQIGVNAEVYVDDIVVKSH